jgi:hypothetical protein
LGLVLNSYSWLADARLDARTRWDSAVEIGFGFDSGLGVALL